MAVFPNLSSAPVHAQSAQAVDHLGDHLAGVGITVPASDSNGSGTTLCITIPIDEDDDRPRVARPCREPLRVDGLKRREALLKGNEGSRRRQRWENVHVVNVHELDRLLNNPYLEPPLPSDWSPGPTYPRHGTVPYYLAPLWDAELAARKKREEKHRERAREAKKAKGIATAKSEKVGKIPKELREKLKRAKGAKGLLQGLEEEVRRFLLGVREWEESEQKRKRERSGSLVVVGEESESDDDGGVVLVGKDGDMEVVPPSPKRGKEVRIDKLVCCGEVGDRGATFGRWLVHAIGRYYGLRTWSVTVGNPPRREAYVGIVKEPEEEERRRLAEGPPRPLWGQL